MPVFPANFVDGPITTEARVARYEAAKAQHAALSAIVTPVSLRQPDKPVPASIVEEAQGLLADLRRLMSREPGRNALLVLHAPPTWAALASRLGVADPGGPKYVVVTGRAALSNNRGKIKELWSPFAKAWWDSADDPDIRLLSVFPEQAEIWDSPNRLIATAVMLTAAATGAKPAVGDHGTARM